MIPQPVAVTQNLNGFLQMMVNPMKNLIMGGPSKIGYGVAAGMATVGNGLIGALEVLETTIKHFI